MESKPNLSPTYVSERAERTSFYPIAPEDNIPVQHHNDMNRHLSLRDYNVEIDVVTGNQVVIISKRQ